MAGPTGAGKTTWLFDMLMRWEKGQDVLGCRSHPVPWFYVAGDRSIDGMNRTLDRMRIPRDQFPTLAAWDQQMTFQQIMGAVKDADAKLAIIEGFGQYVDSPGHTQQVRNFLQSACNICKTDGTTILGIVESPKMKPRDRYENPRQRVSGPAAWGHHTETIFLMEPADTSKADNPDRTLTVCPRNSAVMVVPYTFRFGHLELVLHGKNGHKNVSLGASLVDHE
jgi:AAA domain